MGSDNTNLTVVIVSYNTIEMTRSCLKSVYDHLYGLKVEVIVVDNASIDGTVPMIKDEFPLVELIINEDNKGFATANNQGFLIAKGELVLLLNSDTIILEDVLKKSVDYMGCHPSVGAFGCRVLNSDMTMQPTCSGYPSLLRLFLLAVGLDRLNSFDSYLMREWQRDSEKDVDVVSGCYLLTRKNIITNIGGLDERFFFFGEETDWCLQMRKAGWSVRFSPVGEIIHHGGGSVKKLNHHRDVMLTDATIRLHEKNSGKVAAIIAFLILTTFNVLRTGYWSILSIWGGSDSKSRAKHFQKVVVNTLSTWPKG